MVIYLVNTLESIFHAFNCVIFPILYILSFQNLRKSAFSFLGDQPILSHFSKINISKKQGNLRKTIPHPGGEKALEGDG